MFTDAVFLRTWISVGKSQKYFYLQLTNVGKTQPFVPIIIWCRQKHSIGKKNRERHLNDVTILVFVWLKK